MPPKNNNNNTQRPDRRNANTKLGKDEFVLNFGNDPNIIPHGNQFTQGTSPADILMLERKDLLWTIIDEEVDRHPSTQLIIVGGGATLLDKFNFLFSTKQDTRQVKDEKERYKDDIVRVIMDRLKLEGKKIVTWECDGTNCRWVVMTDLLFSKIKSMIYTRRARLKTLAERGTPAVRSNRIANTEDEAGTPPQLPPPPPAAAAAAVVAPAASRPDRIVNTGDETGARPQLPPPPPPAVAVAAVALPAASRPSEFEEGSYSSDEEKGMSLLPPKNAKKGDDGTSSSSSSYSDKKRTGTSDSDSESDGFDDTGFGNTDEESIPFLEEDTTLGKDTYLAKFGTNFNVIPYGGNFNHGSSPADVLMVQQKGVLWNMLDEEVRRHHHRHTQSDGEANVTLLNQYDTLYGIPTDTRRVKKHKESCRDELVTVIVQRLKEEKKSLVVWKPDHEGNWDWHAVESSLFDKIKESIATRRQRLKTDYQKGLTALSNPASVAITTTTTAITATAASSEEEVLPSTGVARAPPVQESDSSDDDDEEKSKLKVDASKKIQAGCRMYTARKQLYLSLAGVKKIQVAWRVYTKLKVEVHASKTIQACCRMYTTRKRYRIAVEASKTIQACCRMYTARKQLQVAVQAPQVNFANLPFANGPVFAFDGSRLPVITNWNFEGPSSQPPILDQAPAAPLDGNEELPNDGIARFIVNPRPQTLDGNEEFGPSSNNVSLAYLVLVFCFGLLVYLYGFADLIKQETFDSVGDVACHWLLNRYSTLPSVMDGICADVISNTESSTEIDCAHIVLSNNMCFVHSYYHDHNTKSCSVFPFMKFEVLDDGALKSQNLLGDQLSTHNNSINDVAGYGGHSSLFCVLVAVVTVCMFVYWFVCRSHQDCDSNNVDITEGAEAPNATENVLAKWKPSMSQDDVEPESRLEGNKGILEDFVKEMAFWAGAEGNILN